ncbi:MAG: lipoyl synthase [Spirochaetales bacterium]|nr:lipoyl synthase [Spirochaetales bacterium]
MGEYTRKPEWLRISLDTTKDTAAVRKDIREKGLHTVCEEARCPNLHECWSHHRTATFMILGDTCTRSCRFCAVKTGRPDAPDEQEAQRVAASIHDLGIAHAVITMVDRDDLADGGASYLAATGRAIREKNPTVTVEYLSSDMKGSHESVAVLVDSAPDILGHNIETVERLTPRIRSASHYGRSLDFLKTARQLNPQLLVKSSMMLGLGERREEVIQTLQDLRDSGCDLVNIGQYLQPTRRHVAVERYWTPEEFKSLQEEAMAMGFEHVESGPLVRSSYHAGGQLAALLARRAQKNTK